MLKKSTIEEIDPRRLLAQVARILDQSGIAYAVTGGVAVFVWGKPRFTADIDIVVQWKSESIDHVEISPKVGTNSCYTGNSRVVTKEK